MLWPCAHAHGYSLRPPLPHCLQREDSKYTATIVVVGHQDARILARKARGRVAGRRWHKLATYLWQNYPVGRALRPWVRTPWMWPSSLCVVPSHPPLNSAQFTGSLIFLSLFICDLTLERRKYQRLLEVLFHLNSPPYRQRK